MPGAGASTPVPSRLSRPVPVSPDARRGRGESRTWSPRARLWPRPTGTIAVLAQRLGMVWASPSICIASSGNTAAPAPASRTSGETEDRASLRDDRRWLGSTFRKRSGAALKPRHLKLGKDTDTISHVLSQSEIALTAGDWGNPVDLHEVRFGELPVRRLRVGANLLR